MLADWGHFKAVIRRHKKLLIQVVIILSKLVPVGIHFVDSKEHIIVPDHFNVWDCLFAVHIDWKLNIWHEFLIVNSILYYSDEVVYNCHLLVRPLSLNIIPLVDEISGIVLVYPDFSFPLKGYTKQENINSEDTELLEKNVQTF